MATASMCDCHRGYHFAREQVAIAVVQRFNQQLGRAARLVQLEHVPLDLCGPAASLQLGCGDHGRR